LKTTVERKQYIDLVAAVDRSIPEFVREAGNDITRRARLEAPVDTRELQQSIVSVPIGRDAVEIVAKSKHAVFLEYGTLGQQTKPPPVNAVRGWAERHGRDPWAVVWGIFNRGGIKAQPFMRPAVDEFKKQAGLMFTRIFRKNALKRTRGRVMSGYRAARMARRA